MNAFNFQQPGAFDIAGQLAGGFQPIGGGMPISQPYAAPVTQPQSQGFGFNTQTLGTIGNVLGGLGSIAGAIGGFQQIGLAKDQLNFQKDVFAKNWANQVALTNSQLRGRQQARTGASSYYQDVDSYMKENQVK